MMVWLVGCFGLNLPLRQYFSLYRAITHNESILFTLQQGSYCAIPDSKLHAMCLSHDRLAMLSVLPFASAPDKQW